MQNIKIEKMTVDDIDKIYKLELEIFKDDPWPVEWFHEGLSDYEGHYFIAYLDDEIAGYCGMYHISSSLPNYCQISKLAVLQQFRRRGIGKILMLKMLDKARELGLNSAMLEVNTKNDALEFYKLLGFEIKEFKENYYKKSGDDAYIMWHNCLSDLIRS